MDSKFFEFIIGGIIIYFGMQGNAAAQYFSKLSAYLKDDADFFITIISWLYAFNPLANIMIVVAIIISLFISDSADEDGPVIAIFLWPVLGWWVGSSHHDALVEKHACVANSTFGIGCNLDAPIFSGLIYGGVSVYLAAYLGLSLMVHFFGEKENKANE